MRRFPRNDAKQLLILEDREDQRLRACCLGRRISLAIGVDEVLILGRIALVGRVYLYAERQEGGPVVDCDILGLGDEGCAQGGIAEVVALAASGRTRKPPAVSWVERVECHEYLQA